jgi:hypothetical protein
MFRKPRRRAAYGGIWLHTRGQGELALRQVSSHMAGSVGRPQRGTRNYGKHADQRISAGRSPVTAAGDGTAGPRAPVTVSHAMSRRRPGGGCCTTCRVPGSTGRPGLARRSRLACLLATPGCFSGWPAPSSPGDGSAPAGDARIVTGRPGLALRHSRSATPRPGPAGSTDDQVRQRQLELRG